MNSKSDVDADQQSNFVTRSNNEKSQSLTKFSYGDFFVLGGLWIELMKKILIGKKTCVVPKICNTKCVTPTAKQEEIVRRSPETYEVHCKEKVSKNIDLPFDHKDGLSPMVNQHKAYKKPNAKWLINANKDNVIYKCIFPYVKNTRTTMLKKWKESKRYISDTHYFYRGMMKNKISDVKEHIADPNNYVKEKVCMSLSVATGVLIGSRNGRGRAIISGGIGALASGLFCLHRKTEEFFRNLLLRSMVPDDRRNT